MPDTEGRSQAPCFVPIDSCPDVYMFEETGRSMLSTGKPHISVCVDIETVFMLFLVSSPKSHENLHWNMEFEIYHFDLRLKIQF